MGIEYGLVGDVKARRPAKGTKRSDAGRLDGWLARRMGRPQGYRGACRGELERREAQAGLRSGAASSRVAKHVDMAAFRMNRGWPVQWTG